MSRPQYEIPDATGRHHVYEECYLGTLHLALEGGRTYINIVLDAQLVMGGDQGGRKTRTEQRSSKGHSKAPKQMKTIRQQHNRRRTKIKSDKGANEHVLMVCTGTATNADSRLIATFMVVCSKHANIDQAKRWLTI